ncbi:hypothetical protein MYX06_02360 [Patescibacteria group bacterium AH-259-L05]|nr:hypothetical protein [Patescibacteria group bacterium AH-259-L05]
MKRPTIDELREWLLKALWINDGKMRLAFRSSYVNFDEPRADIRLDLDSYKEYEIGGRYWINGIKRYPTDKKWNGRQVAAGSWERLVFDTSRILFGIPSEEETIKERQDRTVRIAAFVKLTGHIRTGEIKKKIGGTKITDTFCAVASDRAITLGYQGSRCILKQHMSNYSTPILLFWIGSLEKLEEK